MASAIVNKPSFLEYKGRRFLIIDAPTDRNVQQYIKEFKKHNVTHLVRACAPSYDTAAVVTSGVEVHEMAFKDGDPPPQHVLDAWLDLCDRVFSKKKSKGDSESKSAPSIAVHCVAGLGRAPVLVCVCLIEAGMAPLEAVEFVRQHRRGAINTRQLTYVSSYRKRSSGCCSIQ